MLKTPLESLLEEGFSELGGLFERRWYGENIRFGASIDGAGEPVSVDDIRKRIVKASTPQQRFIAGFSHFDLSECQDDVLSGTVPFFRRSGLYKGFKVVYYVFTKGDREFYEPIADKLVPEVDYENLEFSWKGHSVALVLLGEKVMVESNLVDDSLHFYPANIKERFAHLKKFDSAPYYPGLVCDAVMSFLR